MGHLLAGVVEHLLPDQLTQEQWLRLVAHGVSWVEVGPGGQISHQASHQLGGAFPGEGTHRMEGPGSAGFAFVAGQQLPVGDRQFHGLARFHQVVFVERQVHRQVDLAQQIRDVGVTPTRRLAAIHQQQHHIHLADRPAGALDKPLTQKMMGLVDAWCIEQHQLGRGCGENGPQPVAGGLGHGRGDRHLLSHQLVEEGRLAHVGATDQGDEAGSESFGAGRQGLGNLHAASLAASASRREHRLAVGPAAS